VGRKWYEPEPVQLKLETFSAQWDGMEIEKRKGIIRRLLWHI
jgi:hypothetical protein